MESSNQITKKRCAVLNCTSNNVDNPDICFVFVPRQQRNAWLRKMESPFPIQKMHCCELHFNPGEDFLNYEEYKLNRLEPRAFLKLKKGVLPHKLLPITTTDQTVASVSRLDTEEELIDPLQSTVSISQPLEEVRLAVPELLIPGDVGETLLSASDSTVEKETVDPLETKIKLGQPSDSGEEEQVITKLPLSPSLNFDDEQPGTSYATSSRQKDDMPYTKSSSTTESDPTVQSKSTVSYNPSTSASSSTDAVVSMPDTSSSVKRTQLEFTMQAMKSHPKRYMGIPIESFHVIEIISDATNINIRDIFIILRKLRMNEPYWHLAIQFELSKTSIGRIINENLALLADAIEAFIIWPEIEDIQINLPNSFKHRFGAVNTIIDCFEIQIEKPTNAVHQVLTYSMYKKCNTIKYLIACLPDGVINFISKGAGGRMSDQEIVRQSGFLEKLSENTMVMADRGFKTIEVDLRGKKCSLVRPPSTTANKQMSNEEVLLNKRIASLRIHVERAIGRLREFQLLKPHATVEAKMISKLDFYVTIACGICNIQSNLINE